jgi:hypothetical protein
MKVSVQVHATAALFWHSVGLRTAITNNKKMVCNINRRPSLITHDIKRMFKTQAKKIVIMMHV